MIVKTLPVGMTQANCYLVGCEQTRIGAVIDPGDEPDRILAAIEESGLEIKYLLLTHAHFDHMGAADPVARATGAALALHPDDLPLLNQGGGARFFGLPSPPIPDAATALVPDQEIAVGQLTLRVLHTPGHSPGHVSYYEPDQGVIFDGDVLFAQGIGRSDLPGGDHATLMHSIQEVLLTLPDDTVVYSGHGPETTIGRERMMNPWL